MKPRAYSSFLSDKETNWITISLILFAAMLPWTIAGMQIGLGLLAVSMLAMVVMKRDFTIFRHRYFLLLFLFIIVRLISAFLSPNPARSLSYVLNNDWIIILVPLLAAAIANTKRMKLVIIVLLTIFAIGGLYGILQMFDGYDYVRQQKLLSRVGLLFRAVGTFGLPLTYAGNQLMALAIAASLYVYEKEVQKLKKFYGIVSVILLASILASFVRSAWISVALILLIAVILAANKKIIYTLIPLIIGIFVVIFTIPELNERFFSIFDLSFDSNAKRVNLWRTSLNMFVDAPVWGIGPGMYTSLFEKYMYPGLYDNWLHAHNDYLNVLAQSGLVGLLAWSGLWVGYYYYALRTLRTAILDPFKRALLVGSMVGVTAILVASLFQCYYTDLENNILWWFIASLGISQFVQQDIEGDQTAGIQ